MVAQTVCTFVCTRAQATYIFSYILVGMYLLAFVILLFGRTYIGKVDDGAWECMHAHTHTRTRTHMHAHSCGALLQLGAQASVGDLEP